MNHNIIEVDITDWQLKLDEILRDEDISFNTVRDLIDMMFKYKLETSDMSKVLSAAKNRGFIVSDKLWPAFKELGLRGGISEMDGAIAQQRVNRTLANGETIEVREFVGKLGRPPGESEEDEKKIKGMRFAPYLSEKGQLSVRLYIKNTIPGAIRKRFELIEDYDDLRELADNLIEDINRIVNALSNINTKTM